MRKKTMQIDNLLVLSRLYESQAVRFLRKWARKTPLSDRLVNDNLKAFLMLYFRASPADIENWSHANETTLATYHFDWQHDLHRLIAKNDKNQKFSIVEYVGED